MLNIVKANVCARLKAKFKLTEQKKRADKQRTRQKQQRWQL